MLYIAYNRDLFFPPESYFDKTSVAKSYLVLFYLLLVMEINEPFPYKLTAQCKPSSRVSSKFEERKIVSSLYWCLYFP